MSDMSSKTDEIGSLRKVGKVTGVHGLKGELYVYVFSKDVSWIDKLETLTLEDVKGVRTNHVVKHVRPFKDGFLVFIDDVNDRTQSENFRSRLVYVDSELFVTEDGDESFYLAEIEGFQVYDKNQLVGVIEGFGSNTVQDLLIVRLDSGVVEIPLVEDFLLEIQFEEKKLFMDLPEGLVESLKDSQK